MAEVFGIVAGAVGTADVVLELAKSVRKLKDFCDDVKNAPEDILDLVEEIHDMTVSLEALAATQSASGAVMGSQPLQMCLEHCKKANKRISMVINQIQQDLKAHRHRTALVFPLKKQKLQEITKKLERSKSSLALACQIYMLSSAKTQAVAQQQSSRDLMAVVQSLGADQQQNFQDLISGQAVLLQRQHTTAVKATPRRRRGSLETRASSVRLRLPAWLLSSVWELSARQATQGWTCSFRSYRIVDRCSPAFKACQAGDVTRLKEMLDAKEVSLYDQDPDGGTLSNAAVQSYQMKTARFLYETGADVQSCTIWVPSLLDLFWFGYWFFAGNNQTFEEDAIRQDFDFLIEDCGNEVEGMKSLLPESYSIIKRPPATWTVDDRFDLVCSLYFCEWVGGGVYGLRLIRYLLSPEDIVPAVWRRSSPAGECLLHILAWAQANDHVRHHDTSMIGALYIKSAVVAGADLHQLTKESATPMQNFMQKWTCFMWLYDPDGLTYVLRSWIRLLAAADVDLEEYGRKEQLVWKAFDCRNGMRIIGFGHGSDVSDWTVFVEHMGDRYAGIFWDMIEHPERMIPGAWEETDKNLWEYEFSERIQRRRAHRYTTAEHRVREIEEQDGGSAEPWEQDSQDQDG